MELMEESFERKYLGFSLQFENGYDCGNLVSENNIKLRPQEHHANSHVDATNICADSM